MSEPSRGVPDEVADADAEVDQGAHASEGGDEVDLDLDEEKLEKWDEVKSDYQVNPDGKPMPNIWDAGETGEGNAEHEAEQRNEEHEARDEAPEPE
jgi:hypothetical protein